MFKVSEDGTSVQLNLTLTREEWDALVMMAGMATGSACRNGMEKLAYITFSRSPTSSMRAIQDGSPTTFRKRGTDAHKTAMGSSEI